MDLGRAFAKKNLARCHWSRIVIEAFALLIIFGAPDQYITAIGPGLPYSGFLGEVYHAKAPENLRDFPDSSKSVEFLRGPDGCSLGP